MGPKTSTEMVKAVELIRGGTSVQDAVRQVGGITTQSVYRSKLYRELQRPDMRFKDTVAVTLRLPRAVADQLRAAAGDTTLADYLSRLVAMPPPVQAARATLMRDLDVDSEVANLLLAVGLETIAAVAQAQDFGPKLAECADELRRRAIARQPTP